jgi:hypothetical protein
MKCPTCKAELFIKKDNSKKSGFFRRVFDCSNCATTLTNPAKGERIRLIAVIFLIVGILSFGGKWSVPEPAPTLLILVGITLLILGAKLMAYATLYKKT